MKNVVLEIKDLSIGLNARETLVKDLNLTIRQGEVHGVIGESGSGKSLTALSIVGLLPAGCRVLNGQILLRNDSEVKSLHDLDQKTLRQIRGKDIGFIFQDPMTSLNPSMRCGNQVIEMILRHQNISRSAAMKVVLELFEKVKLPQPERIVKSYPHEISGGQRQRVMIAIAIANKPRLLIADEPTTALDVTVQHRLIKLIDELRQTENLAVLFISHDLNVIAGLADQVSIMLQGEIVETGSWKEVSISPKHPYTKGLLACRPPMNKRLHRLSTVSDFMSGKNVKEQLYEENMTGIEVPTLMEVKDLNVYYELRRNLLGKVVDEMHALKNISFQLFEGESLGLLGESGSGKSTLGKTILNLIQSRSGKISYRGEVINDLRPQDFRRFRSRIQFIFQDPYASLNPKQTVGAALLEVLMVHKLVKSRKSGMKRVHELLDQVGLGSQDAGKYPHAFSGGQRQRIVIARALAVEPECLVCDEAVSALDVSVQAQILNLLSDLKSKLGLTFLFITHDLGVVRFFCDRVLVMEKGVIVESGKTDTVFANPENEFTRNLLQAEGLA